MPWGKPLLTGDTVTITLLLPLPSSKVLNTDNMSILGLTLDYGPFGFMDRLGQGRGQGRGSGLGQDKAHAH
jgi:hypothetical protein